MNAGTVIEDNDSIIAVKDGRVYNQVAASGTSDSKKVVKQQSASAAGYK